MDSSRRRRVAAESVVSRSSFRVPNAADLVAQEIRTSIVRRVLEPGDALPPEQELTEQFGVSRPVTRQALRILESEGLIEIRRGQFGGPVVRRPDASGAARQFGVLLQYEGAKLHEVFAARRLMEEPAAGRAADHRDPGLIAALKENLEAYQTLLEQTDGTHPRLQAMSSDFHRLLASHEANTALRLFDSMLDSVIENASRSLVESQDTAADRRRLNERSLRSHRHVLDLIESGSVEDAHELWIRHLKEVDDYYMSIAPQSGLVVDLMTRR